MVWQETVDPIRLASKQTRRGRGDQESGGPKKHEGAKGSGVPKKHEEARGSGIPSMV